MSIRKGLRDGWLLFLNGIAIIAVFVVLLFLLEMLRGWFLSTVFFQEEQLNLTYYCMNIATQLAVGFVNLVGVALLTAKSLLLLENKDASMAAAYAKMRPVFSRLVKVWLMLTLISLIPTSVLTVLADYSFLSAQTYLAIAVIYIVCSVTILFVQQYAYCHVLSRNSGRVIEDSLRMLKKTFVKAVVICALYYLMVFFLSPMIEGGTFLQVVFSILITALTYFIVTYLTALFAHASRPKEEEAEEPEENPIETDHKEKRAMFTFRVKPSRTYTGVGDFRCGLARVQQRGRLGSGKWGYADQDGQLVIPCQYKEAGDFQDDLAIVQIDRGEWFIKPNGEKAIHVGYDQADPFQDGRAIVKIGTDWGVIYREGTFHPLPYDELYGFSEGLAVAHDGERWIYIGLTLKPVIKTDYSDVWSFCDGLAMVEQNGKLGYIDANGWVAIPLRYDNASSFSEGLAAVMTVAEGEKRWGYIDHNGYDVIPPLFEQAEMFKQGRAAVCVGGMYGHIDAKGDFITPPEYETVGSYSEGFAVVKEPGGGFGYVDIDGNECVPTCYEYARPLSEGLAWVKSGEGWGLLELTEE
ncbi:MAG: WG repeat-containing protein [Oscillospiraceae bacterium]|nr:WG repeat-containing protein [Oscillospiraceae bacterium]